MTSLDEFVDVARRYCAWANSGGADEPSAKENIRAALELGSELYAAAIRIQDERFAIDQEGAEVEWEPEGPLPRLRAQYYKQELEPLDLDRDYECGMGDLYDDLGTVANHVGEGLAHWDAGHRSQALWGWTFEFRIHWGEHLVDALGILHRLVAEDSD